MEKAKIKTDLDRAEHLLSQYFKKVGQIDPGLKDAIRADRKQAVVKELIEDKENGMDTVRRRLRAGVQELRAERERLSDPGSALLVAAWSRASELTPSQLAILETARNASPAILGQFMDMTAKNAPALVVLGNVLVGRKKELEQDGVYADLYGKYSEAAKGFVSKAGVVILAELELKAVALEYQAACEIDGVSGARKLSIARELDAIQRVVGDAA